MYLTDDVPGPVHIVLACIYVAVFVFALVILIVFANFFKGIADLQLWCAFYLTYRVDLTKNNWLFTLPLFQLDTLSIEDTNIPIMLCIY